MRSDVEDHFTARVSKLADDGHDVTYDERPVYPWTYEPAIPDDTNGWVYVGMWGLPRGASWVPEDRWRDGEWTVALLLIENATHPQSDTPTRFDLQRVTRGDEGRREKERLARFNGEPGQTPDHVRQRLFWEGVTAAVAYMENNPPHDG